MPSMKDLGLPTLAEILTKAAEERQEREKLEADAAQKAQDVATMRRYQQANLVDPKTGKSVAGIFDPVTSEYKLTGHQLGYAPKIDPETKYLVPASVAEERGLQGLGPAQQPAQPGSLGLESYLKPQESAAPPTPQQQSRVSPLQREGMEKQLGQLRDNPQYKELSTSIAEFDNISSLGREATRNPAAAQQLGTVIARAYQGGRLTDRDIEIYVTDPSLKGLLRDVVNRRISGTMSPELIRNLNRAIGLIQKNKKGEMQRVVDSYSQSAGGLYGVTPQQTRPVFNPPAQAKQLRPPSTPEASAAIADQNLPPEPGAGDRLLSFLGLGPKKPSARASSNSRARLEELRKKYPRR